jgi:hypothetical protein
VAFGPSSGTLVIAPVGRWIGPVDPGPLVASEQSLLHSVELGREFVERGGNPAMELIPSHARRYISAVERDTSQVYTLLSSRLDY